MAKELRKRNGVEFLSKELVESWENKISAHYEKTTDSERELQRTESQDKFQIRLKYLKYIYQQGGNLLLSPDASGIYSIPGFGILQLNNKLKFSQSCDSGAIYFG